MKKVLFLLFIIGLTACHKSSDKILNIGRQSFDFLDTERNRPLKVEIWYPTQDSIIEDIDHSKLAFKALPSVQNGKFIEGKFPLLIISHGTGGNRFSLTWLIEKMVKEGYVVVSLGHYGNTSFQKLPREFLKWWERAIDIQFVLDEIFKTAEISTHIDKDRIGGIGFSLGGYTNIALAGGKVDRKLGQLAELPPEFPKTDEEIDLEHDSLILESYLRYKDKVKDERIKAFFVMAPAIGFGFNSPEQVKEITAPVYIVAGKGDQNTPIEQNAIKYHKLIPTSEIHLFDQNVGHYIFLNEGTDFGKKVIPELTIDNEGVDRAKIHDEVIKLAKDFFGKHLKGK